MDGCTECLSLYNQLPSTSEDDANAPPRFMMGEHSLYSCISSVGPALAVATPSLSHRPSPDPMLSWRSLPPEMKLSIVDHLNVDELKTLSLLDQGTHLLVVPRLFKVRSSAPTNPTPFA
jgi:hypothetical protein